MSLTVETGNAGSDSESYASVSDADSYFSLRGFELWDAQMSTTEKEQALRRGTEYMQSYYNGRWKGEKQTGTQALDWPRYGVMVDGYELDDSSIPTILKNACIKLAYKAAGGDLVPDLDRPTTMEKVGEIAVSYAPGARQQVRYQEIDNMLAVFLAGSSSMAQVTRA